jgi:hypothetical protein
MGWFRRLFPERPCDCDACAGRVANKSRSINVSHGLYIWVGDDGKMHYRAKSRIVDQ